MTKPITILPDIVGQQNLKKIFNFHLKPYKKNGVFPTTLLNASMGEGKTMMMECLADELDKRYFVVNCSVIRNARDFVESIYQTEMNLGDDYTVVADEFQTLDKSTQSLLLTLLTPNKKMYNETVFSINGVPITLKFDLRKNTFLAATTNVESIIAPLKDRFRVHSMEKYSPQDLSEILKRNLNPNVFVIESAMKEVMIYIRANPRSCVMFAQDINQYCEGEGIKVFKKSMWHELKDTLSLRPYGLDAMEENLLTILKGRSLGIRLTNLAASMRLDNKTVQSVERYLMYHDLMMNIDGLRNLTDKGKKYFTIK